MSSKTDKTMMMHKLAKIINLLEENEIEIANYEINKLMEELNEK